MGWTTTHAAHYKNGKVDRKAECDAILNYDCTKYRDTVLKSQMVGSTYYAAIRRENKNFTPDEVWAAVFRTCGQDRSDPYFNFGYKDMSEFEGPTERNCPKSILDMLTPTDSKWANEWRQACYENLEKKKAGNWLKDLPFGAKVRATIFGKEYTLIKHAPAYRFKTWFWYVPESHTYMPKSRVTVDNAVVVTA